MRTSDMASGKTCKRKFKKLKLVFNPTKRPHHAETRLTALFGCLTRRTIYIYEVYILLCQRSVDKIALEY